MSASTSEGAATDEVLVAGSVAPPTRGSGSLPARTRLGPVELTVSDLERATAFYTEALGLGVQSGDGAHVALGADGEDLLVLFENRAARRAGRHAGLYHVALLYPSREELARAALRLAVTRTPIQGASDHGTHEAIYLADPDGNGLELAADRPRERWPDIHDASLFAGGPQPLNLDGLLGLVGSEDARRRAAEGVRVGHLHLHVADTTASLHFYTDLIGFEKIVALGNTAAFVSAGGYHHHLAFNTWRGQGVGPAPADAVGLRYWTIYVPSEADVEAVRERSERAGVACESRAAAASRAAALLLRDPSGNAVLVAADPARPPVAANGPAGGPAGDAMASA